MIIRVLLFLFALFLLINIVITLISVICGVNLYKKHGNIIFKGYGVFILFIVIVYVIFALLGLM